jgi:hypothetical protein
MIEPLIFLSLFLILYFTSSELLKWKFKIFKSPICQKGLYFFKTQRNRKKTLNMVEQTFFVYTVEETKKYKRKNDSKKLSFFGQESIL